MVTATNAASMPVIENDDCKKIIMRWSDLTNAVDDMRRWSPHSVHVIAYSGSVSFRRSVHKIQMLD